VSAVFRPVRICWTVVINVTIPLSVQSRDSSVGVALGYGLDDRSSRVRFPAGAGNFSLHYRVQNSSGTHPASYPMRTTGSFPGSKSGRGVKLTTHPQLVLRSMNAWSYKSTPQYALMAWCPVRKKAQGQLYIAVSAFVRRLLGCFLLRMGVSWRSLQQAVCCSCGLCCPRRNISGNELTNRGCLRADMIHPW
jgi:hypothetical protein